MVSVAVIGATGYAGSELVNILSRHDGIRLSHLCSHSYAGRKFSEIYPSFFSRVDSILEEDDIKRIADDSDVIFLALPHGIASALVSSELLKEKVVIDLGADFRLKDKDTYEAWYKTEHRIPELIASAVYGLPEVHRKDIRKSHLIANPGCYTTCSILTLYPLLKHGLIESSTIVVDAKSGVSGAGRGEKIANLFCEVNESVKAYGVASHRHTPEIEQELSTAAGEEVRITFTPHLIPMQRGILSTCYAMLKSGVKEADVEDAYHECYDGEPFVRLSPYLPETRFVKGTNYADISYRIDNRTGRIIAIGAIDNLIKGAAGQAVQNMNIAFGFDERKALEGVAVI